MNKKRCQRGPAEGQAEKATAARWDVADVEMGVERRDVGRRLSLPAAADGQDSARQLFLTAESKAPKTAERGMSARSLGQAEKCAGACHR